MCRDIPLGTVDADEVAMCSAGRGSRAGVCTGTFPGGGRGDPVSRAPPPLAARAAETTSGRGAGRWALGVNWDGTVVMAVSHSGVSNSNSKWLYLWGSLYQIYAVGSLGGWL